MRFSHPLKSRSAKSAKVSRHKPDVKNVIRVAFRFNIGDLVYHHKNTKMWGQIVGRGRFGEPLEGSALLQQKWTKERVRDSPTAPPNWYYLTDAFGSGLQPESVLKPAASRMMIALMAAAKDNASHRSAISSPLCMLARAPTLLAVGRLLNFDSRELDVIRSTPGIDLALLRRLPHEDKRRLIHDALDGISTINQFRLLDTLTAEEEAEDRFQRSWVFRNAVMNALGSRTPSSPLAHHADQRVKARMSDLKPYLWRERVCPASILQDARLVGSHSLMHWKIWNFLVDQRTSFQVHEKDHTMSPAELSNKKKKE